MWLDMAAAVAFNAHIYTVRVYVDAVAKHRALCFHGGETEFARAGAARPEVQPTSVRHLFLM